MINASGHAAAQPALGPRHARPAAHPLSGTRAAVLRALIGAGEAVTVAALAEQLGQHPNTVREHLDSLVAAGRTERLRSQPSGRGRPAWLYRAVGPTEVVGDGVRSDRLGTEGEEYAGLAIALIDEVSRSTPDPRRMARQAGERWGSTMAQRHLDRATDESARGADGQGSGGSVTVPGTVPGSGSTETDPGNLVTDSGNLVTDSGNLPGSGSTETGSTAPPCCLDPSGTVVDMLAGLRFEPQPATNPGTVRLTTCPLLDAARRNPDVVCEVHLGIVRGALGRLGGDPDGADLVPFAEPGACLLSLPSRQ